MVQELTAKGIGVNLRRSMPATSTHRPPAAPTSSPSAGRTR
ncbi:hypothetical protein [Streptomyces liliiviolaceus]|nr:hypothetical protein [Streptomyces liliiviolaceus]